MQSKKVQRGAYIQPTFNFGSFNFGAPPNHMFTPY